MRCSWAVRSPGWSPATPDPKARKMSATQPAPRSQNPVRVAIVSSYSLRSTQRVEFLIMRRHDTEERLPQFLALVLAIGHFSQAGGQRAVAECPFRPADEILPAVMVLQAADRQVRDELQKFIKTGGFLADPSVLVAEPEALARRQRRIQIFVEVADMRDPPDRGTHPDCLAAAQKRVPHRNLVETGLRQPADAAMLAEAAGCLRVRHAGEQAVV